jgi:hypothetical protein
LDLKRHPQNVAGPFYVANGECMACGAPESQAGTLMSHDGSGHCFFVRQPSTAEEVDATILGLWSSCCGAVRYGGHDHEILVRLAEIGKSNTCDFRLENEPKQAHITHLTFEFADAEAPKSGLLAAREIMEYFAVFLTKSHNVGSRVLDFRLSDTTASFRYEWGHNSLPTRCSVTFALEAYGENSWLLRIRREDRPNSLGDGIAIYKAIERDRRFQQVQWFTEDEWKKGAHKGRARLF